MKQYMSRFLKSFALFYLGFPIVYVILAALLFDVPANHCVRILLSPLYYVVTFTAVAAGFGLWEMKRWAWYVFNVANALIIYESAIIVNEHGETHHKVMAFIFSIILVLSGIYRVGREIRVPYFFPKIRWWESNPRYKLSVPVAIHRKAPLGPSPSAAQPELAGDILDLSMGGCFIKLRGEFSENELIELTFKAFRIPIHCEGNIVWKTQSTVTHPRGIGIKFAVLSRPERRNLRLVTRKLKKIAVLYRKSRYLLNQEEFLKRLEEIEERTPESMGTKA